MKVPQFRSFVDKGDYAYLERVFENNYIAEGPCCREFTNRLKSLIGAPHAVLASNGTVALYLGMKALGISSGDEVVVQNLSFIASANSIEMVGATPVFVDIKAHDDLTVDLSKVKVTSKTKAIMIAHLFGSVCSNIEDVQAFCKEHGLWLIEDAAQTIGIRNDTAHCGMFGDIGAFSFYADKTITTAEGGLVVTPHEDVHEKMVYLRNQGRKSSGTFVHPEIGYNFRMTDMQGALGLSQLDKLDRIIAEKSRIARLYHQHLGEHVGFLKLRSDFNYIPFRVIAFVPDADKVMAHMAAAEIEPRSMFYPFHKQPCYAYLDYDSEDFPMSEKCFREGICLPTWIGMSDDMIAHTSQKLLETL